MGVGAVRASMERQRLRAGGSGGRVFDGRSGFILSDGRIETGGVVVRWLYKYVCVFAEILQNNERTAWN